MTDELKDHADVIVMPPMLYLTALVAGAAAQLIAGGDLDALGVWRFVAGGILVLLGLAGSLRFARTFEEAGQQKSPRTSTPALITGGIYRLSRNPAYVSLTAILVGIGLLASSPWILATVPVVVIVMHFGVIRREEAYLEASFGDAYREYKERVRRWL